MSPLFAPPAAGGGGGAAASALLAVKEYNPVTLDSITSSSTAYADVDTTGFAVTFTVPASGSVIVKASARVSAGGGSELGWNLREGAADIARTNALVRYNSYEGFATRTWLITGLTPGAVHTYKLGFARIAGTTNLVTVHAGGVAGAASMEVWDAATSGGVVATIKHEFTSFAGTITLPGNTSWANLPSMPVLTVPAVVGDVIEMTFGCRAGPEATSLFLDAVTEVAGAPVNSFGSQGAAPAGTADGGIDSLVFSSGGALGSAAVAHLVVQAGDITAGAVTVRMRYRCSSVTNRTLGGGVRRTFFGTKNLGVAA